MIVLQSVGEVVPNLSEGQALMYVGTFIALTLIVFKLKSAISLFTWALSGVMLVMAIVGFITAPLYWAVMALSFIGSIASTLYTITNV